MDLTKQESHFEFGKNWAAYAKRITAAEIEEAIRGLKRLLGDNLKGRRFLDIGCGSGIHSVAALELGAREVVAIDIDPQSTATTRMVLQRHSACTNFSVLEASVFELDPNVLGHFDIVYAWGVLHHTGKMERSIRVASRMVAADGLFALSLYHRTLLCPIWKLEKRLYATLSPNCQCGLRWLYIAIKALRLCAKGRSYREFTSGYKRHRGMSFYHDVHDWLGGYPYESVLPGEVERIMKEINFSMVRRWVQGGFGARLGLFGTGCNEYVYRRH